MSMSFPLEATRRRKLATILFCDVSGSTALGESADPETVRDLMFRYFHEMRSAIEYHGGTIEKFIGDAVVAVFGVPIAHEDDALRAIRAAAEMQARAGVLIDDLERRFGIRIALRIGVNSGEVVAGDASARETFVTGDTVNVAARLEQHARPGDVLLGESTYRLVGDAVVADLLDPIDAKGKSQPLTVYRLAEVRLPVGGPVRRASSPLVGRQAELGELQRTLADVTREGICRLTTVLGEPGVGKSRLAAELIARAGSSVTVLKGRCLSYGEGITYWPVAEMLRTAAQICDEDTTDEALARLHELLPGEPVASVHLARMLGLAEGASSSAEIAWAIRVLLRAIAARSALLVLVDDVQWAEPTLLDLLADLPATTEGPVLVLCLARPELLERHSGWGPTLQLEPLDGAASDDLLAGVLAGGSVPDDVRTHVAVAARGNPLFIEELAAMLLDDHILVRRNGSWEATREIADFPVPPSVTALLGARLDRLDEGSRLVLERGAVEGEVFHRGAVIELSPPRERESIAPVLRTLAERALLHPAKASFVDEAAFRFRHILLREAAYRGTAKRLRAELHERFAGWLERTVGERLAEYEEIAGYHLEQSYQLRTELGPPDEEAASVASRASRRLGSAGRRAFGRGDLRAANNLLGRALELTQSPSTDVAVDLIEARLGFGDFVGARRVIDVLEEQHGEIERRYADVYASFVDIQLNPEGANHRAIVRAESALAGFAELHDERGLAKAWALRASVHMARGELARTRNAGERSRHFAALAGDVRQEADGLKMIGAAAFYGHAPASESSRLFVEQMQWARRHADLGTEAELLVATAVVRATQGDFQAARETAARGEALLVELGCHVHVAAFNASGQIALLAGDYVEAERCFRRAYTTLEERGEKSYLSTVAFQVARALFERGRLAESWSFVERSRRLGGTDDVVTQFGWRSIGARVLAAQGRLADAERLAREAVVLIEATEYVHSHAEALFDLGVVLASGSHERAAADALAHAALLWERKENLVMAGRARAALRELQSSGSPSQ
jgi:class 3 adenylate cyclase/tetratricopeptide (TPR) repeat protein